MLRLFKQTGTRWGNRRKGMYSIRERLSSMFSKIMAGTVSREEGAMLINHLVRDNMNDTVRELSYIMENPPQNVFPKTMLHTITLARNRALFSILVSSLNHKDEEVAVLAAAELARLRTNEARDVLRENLNSEAYHVRKASAAALARELGDEGIEILKNHILTHQEPFYRSTSAQGLLSAGRKGMEALLSILSSGKPGVQSSVAEAISTAYGEGLQDTDIQVAVDALMRAGDRKDTPSIVELLKVIALFRKRAGSYGGYVEAFADYPSESVRKEVQKALSQIRGG